MNETAKIKLRLDSDGLMCHRFAMKKIRPVPRNQPGMTWAEMRKATRASGQTLADQCRSRGVSYLRTWQRMRRGETFEEAIQPGHRACIEHDIYDAEAVTRRMARRVRHVRRLTKRRRLEAGRKALLAAKQAKDDQARAELYRSLDWSEVPLCREPDIGLVDNARVREAVVLAELQTDDLFDSYSLETRHSHIWGH